MSSLKTTDHDNFHQLVKNKFYSSQQHSIHLHSRTVVFPFVFGLQGAVDFSRVMVVAAVRGEFYSGSGFRFALHLVKSII